MCLYSNHELYSEVLQEAQREQHFNTLHWNSLLCQHLVSYRQVCSIVYFNSCHKYWRNIDRDVGIKSIVAIRRQKKMQKKYLH